MEFAEWLVEVIVDGGFVKSKPPSKSTFEVEVGVTEIFCKEPPIFNKSASTSMGSGDGGLCDSSVCNNKKNFFYILFEYMYFNKIMNDKPVLGLEWLVEEVVGEEVDF